MKTKPKVHSVGRMFFKNSRLPPSAFSIKTKTKEIPDKDIPDKYCIVKPPSFVGGSGDKYRIKRDTKMIRPKKKSFDF